MLDPGSLYLSKTEIQQIRQEFLQAIETLTPGLRPAGEVLYSRISSPHWALEWGLARWIGEAYGLPEPLIHTLTLANIFLLGFVRISDDLVDMDFQPAEIPIDWLPAPQRPTDFSAAPQEQAGALSPSGHSQSVLLGILLQNLWLKQHLSLLESHEIDPCRYWEDLTEALSQWIIATSDQERRPAHGFSSFTEADFLRMGHRFSLLKTCGVASCLLAGRHDCIGPLSSAVDHILVGVVLMDDAFDWLSDLQQGRYNAFVAYCTGSEQTRQRQDLNRQEVLHAVYIEQKLHPFFDIILARLATAGTFARQSGVEKLAAFINCLSFDMQAYQQKLDQYVLAQLREASGRYVRDHP